ncbi:MAG: acyl-CoA dehydrogenase family protein [Luminiphilus sp.]|nr:acyl-CoA dehydrogenase family protein [Luminiphilus sp.]
MAESKEALKKFKTDVAAWMKENVPADPGFLLPLSFLEVGTEQQLDFLRAWQHKLWSAGFLGMHWPSEYGGQGADPAYQGIVDRELGRFNAPIIFNTIGLGWTGPLLLEMGTDAEKAKYLKHILSADEIWCQGFSEPDHGSDLGAVQTRAVRDGDEYVINGSKIWTTLGNYADHMILLARTDPTAQRKYDGLSFFLSPMKVPGVDAVPIRKVTGEYGFNQVFFTDTRIPAETLMLGEGQGWGVAMKTLEYERGVSAGQATGHWMVSIEIDDLIDDLRGFERDGAPLFEDPAVRDQAVGLIMEAKALSLSARRMGLPALTSDFPMGLPLSSKYRGTEWARRMKLFGAAMQGARSALYIEDDDAHRGGFWQRAYFSNFGATIGGGTSQVQANIIAEHVLGLPK